LTSTAVGSVDHFLIMIKRALGGVTSRTIKIPGGTEIR